MKRAVAHDPRNLGDEKQGDYGHPDCDDDIDFHSNAPAASIPPRRRLDAIWMSWSEIFRAEARMSMQCRTVKLATPAICFGISVHRNGAKRHEPLSRPSRERRGPSEAWEVRVCTPDSARPSPPIAFGDGPLLSREKAGEGQEQH